MTSLSSQVIRRINNEIKKMKEFESITSGISAAPININDITRWNAMIIGPSGTPYDGGIFNLNIVFPSNFPTKPPRIQFTTSIYHPNISTNGSICLDLLQDKWSAALKISDILMSISSLLNDPNPQDPLNTDAANMYINNKNEFLKTARNMTISSNS